MFGEDSTVEAITGSSQTEFHFQLAKRLTSAHTDIFSAPRHGLQILGSQWFLIYVIAKKLEKSQRGRNFWIGQLLHQIAKGLLGFRVHLSIIEWSSRRLRA